MRACEPGIAHRRAVEQASLHPIGRQQIEQHHAGFLVAIAGPQAGEAGCRGGDELAAVAGRDRQLHRFRGAVLRSPGLKRLVSTKTVRRAVASFCRRSFGGARGVDGNRFLHLLPCLNRPAEGTRGPMIVLRSGAPLRARGTACPAAPAPCAPPPRRAARGQMIRVGLFECERRLMPSSF